MTEFPAPTEADIQKVVDLVVETVSPLRIVLFGSAARGEMRPGSDLDMLVVVPDGAKVRECERLLFGMRRPGVQVPVDFVVTTPSVLEAYQGDVGYIYRRAMQDGRELYAA